MVDQKKFLDQEGVKHLWSKVNMQDYPNNEMLIGVINAIDETKEDKPFIITLNDSQCNKTYEEIWTAYKNGLTLKCYYIYDENTMEEMQWEIDSSSFWAHSMHYETSCNYYVYPGGNNVSTEIVDILSLFEDNIGQFYIMPIPLVFDTIIEIDDTVFNSCLYSEYSFTLLQGFEDNNIENNDTSDNSILFFPISQNADKIVYKSLNNYQIIITRNSFLATKIPETQTKITGTPGQFVVIGDDGNVTTKTIPNAEEASF